MNETNGLSEGVMPSKNKKVIVDVLYTSGKLLVGMAIGYFTHMQMNLPKEEKLIKEIPVETTVNHRDVEVWFNNDNGAFMIDDKKSGERQIYNDSIALKIFNFHAMKMYNKTQQ